MQPLPHTIRSSKIWQYYYQQLQLLFSFSPHLCKSFLYLRWTRAACAYRDTWLLTESLQAVKENSTIDIKGSMSSKSNHIHQESKTFMPLKHTIPLLAHMATRSSQKWCTTSRSRDEKLKHAHRLTDAPLTIFCMTKRSVIILMIGTERRKKR